MKGKWRYVFLALLAIGVILLLRETFRIGQLAADISAKWACSCYFVGRNNAAICRVQDPVYFADMELAFDDNGNTVTASWLGFSALGRNTPGKGCKVE